MKYGVQDGQIYLAADGSKHGCLVVDSETYAHIDDVLVHYFDMSGFIGSPQRIDNFKLAHVRYSLVGKLPEWFDKRWL